MTKQSHTTGFAENPAASRLTETQMAIAELVIEHRVSVSALEKLAMDKFPDATVNDILTAFEAGAAMLEKQAEQAEAELASMQFVSQLFDGMPEGMTLEECAIAKAEKGDPVAISFIEWRKQQEGGEQ